MHSARAGPVALEQVAASMSAFLVMAMVPPGQVTEISFSPGLQARSQLLLWPQPPWRSACRPLDPAAPGGPGGPIGPVSPLTPCGPCGPASPWAPGDPCGPSKQPASANAATTATIASDARMEDPLNPVSGNENVSPPHDGVNLPARCHEISGAAPDCGRSIVVLAMFDRRYGRRRHEAWIDVAEAAIAGDDVGRARLGGAKFAIPHHVASAEILHRAPRRIAVAAGLGGRNAGAH